MKIRYATTAALALSLVTGCVEIKVDKDGCECKVKHSEREEKEGREEHEHEPKDKHKEKEKEEGEERESKHEHEEGEAAKRKDSPAQLKAQAKISEAEARETALEKVPNGVIKEGELERERGHLQWSFDIATPDTKDTTEVNIDAISGKIIDISREKPESEQAEKENEAKEKD